MSRFADIPLFPRSFYVIDVGFEDLEAQIDHSKGLDLDPDFQREHVWTAEQQSSWLEYIISGGENGKDVIVNAPNWHRAGYQGATLVDGKQRIQAIRQFMSNKVPVFGAYRSEYTDHMRFHCGIRWRVINLSRTEVLRHYIALNAGGTPHSPLEIQRVQALLRQEEVENA